MYRTENVFLRGRGHARPITYAQSLTLNHLLTYNQSRMYKHACQNFVEHLQLEDVLSNVLLLRRNYIYCLILLCHKLLIKDFLLTIGKHFLVDCNSNANVF